MAEVIPFPGKVSDALDYLKSGFTPMYAKGADLAKAKEYAGKIIYVNDTIKELSLSAASNVKSAIGKDYIDKLDAGKAEKVLKEEIHSAVMKYFNLAKDSKLSKELNEYLTNKFVGSEEGIKSFIDQNSGKVNHAAFENYVKQTLDRAKGEFLESTYSSMQDIKQEDVVREVGNILYTATGNEALKKRANKLKGLHGRRLVGTVQGIEEAVESQIEQMKRAA